MTLGRSNTAGLLIGILISLTLIVTLSLGGLRMLKQERSIREGERLMKSPENSSGSIWFLSSLCGHVREARSKGGLRARLRSTKHQRERSSVSICVYLESGLAYAIYQDSPANIPQISRVPTLPLGTVPIRMRASEDPIQQPAKVYRSSILHTVFDATAVSDMPWLITMPPESVVDQ